MHGARDVRKHSQPGSTTLFLVSNGAAALAMSGICDAHRCSQAAAAWANGGVLSGRQQTRQAGAARPPVQDAAMAPQQSSQGGMYANRGSTGVAGRLGGRQQGTGIGTHIHTFLAVINVTDCQSSKCS